MAGLYTILDKQHRDVLDRAVRNVLGTDLALETCAQIADGLPLARVACDRYRPTRYEDHPIADHTSLCPGAERAAWEFLSEFALSMLNFDDKLLQSYQSMTPSRRGFYCRLIELVTVAVHKIAVLLFKKRLRIHDKQPQNAAYTIKMVTSWQSKEDKNLKLRLHPPGRTMFAHLSYDAKRQYPNGTADMVGYWAENRIMGGVVVFDRSQVWANGYMPEPNVYLHSDRAGVTIRVWQLLGEQQEALVNFLLSIGTCPFPLYASERNLVRFDPDKATWNKVYRDIWEREPPRHVRGRGGGFMGCVQTELDYPRVREARPRW
ncbi:uncharacterized protein B0H64DRAFT_455679 [Chaetomium fimeti]|uniref:Uncharacterized protein n=1 Tax=Chaetomium fimeti TaxID=1854472 RepID=A0AAE0HNR2_9PEZI|nr:hypothetical protein B0H64DRAFT_455679 [Chaetomium fimeti]